MVLDEQKIEQEAKEILDKFAEALKSVDKVDVDSYVDRDEFERVEGEGKESIVGFKERVLQNAPEHDDDFILVEKGSWK